MNRQDAKAAKKTKRVRVCSESVFGAAAVRERCGNNRFLTAAARTGRPGSVGWGLVHHASRARLARLGLKPGFPDILVWWKPTKDDVWARSLGIELKSVIGRPTNAQQARHAALLAIGVPVRICKSEEEVVLWLRQNHVPMNRFTLIGGKHGDSATESSSQEELAQGAWR